MQQRAKSKASCALAEGDGVIPAFHKHRFSPPASVLFPKQRVNSRTHKTVIQRDAIKPDSTKPHGLAHSCSMR